MPTRPVEGGEVGVVGVVVAGTVVTVVRPFDASRMPPPFPRLVDVAVTVVDGVVWGVVVFTVVLASAAASPNFIALAPPSCAPTSGAEPWKLSLKFGMRAPWS